MWERLTVRFGDREFLALGFEFDFELVVVLSQGVKLVNGLVQPLAEGNSGFGTMKIIRTVC